MITSGLHEKKETHVSRSNHKIKTKMNDQDSMAPIKPACPT